MLKKFTNPSDIDKILNDSDSEKKTDKFELYASSENKNVLIIDNNGKIYLRISELNNKILVNEQNLLEFDWKYFNSYKKEGLIVFNGKIRNSNNEEYNLKIKLNLNEILPKFHFYNDITNGNFAETISKEYWSKDYFKNFIIFENQNIFGNQGELNGYAEIDNQKFDLNLNYSRISFNGDQLFPRICHRYVLHHIVLENGNRFCVGVASLTQQFSCIAIGYVMIIDHCRNFGIDNCDLELHRFGENDEDPPRTYGFRVNANNILFNIIVRTIAALRFETTNDYGRKIIDSGCGFNVNGINGWGTTVWYYRNK